MRSWSALLTIVTTTTTRIWLAAASPMNPAPWYDQGLAGAYPRREYVSFDQVSPRLNVLASSDECDRESLLFIEPRGASVPGPGPVILDGAGELVWMDDRFGEVMDFRAQTYRGGRYLTFWTGTDDGTHGHGSYYMLDEAYEVYKKIDPAGGVLEGDLHEFQLTADGTALMTIYETVPADLSSVPGGTADGWIYDSLFQEIDIATGALVFEWRASEHYAFAASFNTPRYGQGRTRDNAWDFFHINSVDKDAATGNYYISSRYMHTVACISPAGDVLWQLGGASTDFTDLSGGAASNFTWQHHARLHANNTLTLFDNGAYSTVHVSAEYSRGLLLQLDLAAMTVSLLAAYVSPARILSGSQGSVQLLDNGHAFVGWGLSPAWTEFAPDGRVLCDVHFGAQAYFATGRIKSYRAFRSRDWAGLPRGTGPALALDRSGSGSVYVSWNGATGVARWRLQSAGSPDAPDDGFMDAAEVARDGFETAFELDDVDDDFLGQYLRVLALDGAGEVLGVSKVLDRKGGGIVDGAFVPMQDSELVPMHLFLACMALTSIVWVAWSWIAPKRSRGPPLAGQL